MKLLVSALLILLAAVSAALIARNDPGYLLISHGAWRLETTLALAVIALLAGFVAFYYLIRLLVNIWRTPRRLSTWQRGRLAHKARATLTRGLIQLEEGEWYAAEQNLIKHAEAGDPPLLHYLAAARAAQRQGAHERRDNYLRLAHQSTPSADVAVGLTQAELQLSHHQTEQALASLTHLRRLAPKHAYVLKLLMKLYVELHDWRALLELLPELRKRQIINAEQAEQLERRAYAGLLNMAARVQTLQHLHATWSSIPKRLRLCEDVLLGYVQQLRLRGEELHCEALLRETLKKNWSDALAYVYGLVQGPDPVKQLAYAEAWLKDHDKNAVLLLTLGRLAARNRLWGKARAYLEASLGAAPRSETYQELGNLLEQMNEPEAARDAYRKGLFTVVGNNHSALPKPTKTEMLLEALSTQEHGRHG